MSNTKYFSNHGKNIIYAIKATAISLLLLSLLINSVACMKVDSEIESFNPVYRDSDYCDLHNFDVETFEYDQYGSRGGLLNKKGTGYRIIKAEESTQEKKCICIDPLCSHDEKSECPVVFLNEIVLLGTFEQIIVFKTKQSDTVTECWQYDMSTGESFCIFKTTGGTVTTEIGCGYLFYIVPDVIDGKSVYTLNRYNPLKKAYKQLTVSDMLIKINVISNIRVYFGTAYTPFINITEPSGWSVNYEGEDYREESGVNFSAVLTYDSYVYGFPTLSVEGYNVSTGKKIIIGHENGASAIGYWEKENKLVYTTCDDYKIAVSMSADTYCEKYNISSGEYQSSKEHSEKMEEERKSILFKEGMKVYSCDLDGNNENLLFVLSSGLFVSSGIYREGRAGCIDGDYMYVVMNDTDYQKQNYKIDLNTGEMIVQ